MDPKKCGPGTAHHGRDTRLGPRQSHVRSDRSGLDRRRLAVFHAVARCRVAFVFSDTLIGMAQPDGTASMTGLARSSELVGVLPNLSQDYGGTFRHPTSCPDTIERAEWETDET